MSITGVDEIREMDSGYPMGFLLYGDVTPDDVDWFMGDDDMTTAFPNGGDFDVTDCYVRKVPATDEYGYNGMRYVFTTKPGRGARKCVRVEENTFWGHWCANHMYEPAVTGIPVERVLDPPWPMVLNGCVYLCRECAKSFTEREQAERHRLMEEYRARQLANA